MQPFCLLFSLYLLFSPSQPSSTFITGQKETVSVLALIHFSLYLWLGLSVFVCFYVYASMIPAYRHSVSSLMPLDLNEDQNHQLFTPNHQVSSSFSSLSYPIFYNPPDQDKKGSYYEEPKHLPSDEEGEKIIPSSGSWDHHSVAEKHESSSEHKMTVWKKEERDENLQAAEDGSVKWMSSKMRMMRKMMVSDQTGSDIAGNSMHKFEDQKQPLSPLGTDNSSNNYSNHSNNTVRVCADCHTTKTPLWRSGPRGPKSLCNACGIRQRKARRALAVASANGVHVAAETSVKGNKLKKKENKSKIVCAPQMKKKRKLRTKPSQSRKKLGFEDFALSLSNNMALQQVFPQDEKEAAILLMALSYGLVHG
ncbi:putative GATA transcription factor 22 [Gastrolobium bilobum]|uniref:putative GATA transcription factor 22 n=1 Tax=Gastrolobium bilobum TaxID=150636 RepID=UPI002AB00FD8|nr:putative GATA transcription factor 22 [Gastrolobium bilobum]